MENNIQNELKSKIIFKIIKEPLAIARKACDWRLDTTDKYEYFACEILGYASPAIVADPWDSARCEYCGIFRIPDQCQWYIPYKRFVQDNWHTYYFCCEDCMNSHLNYSE